MKKYRYRKNKTTDNLYGIQKLSDYWGYYETQFHVQGKQEAIETVKHLNDGGKITVQGVKLL